MNALTFKQIPEIVIGTHSISGTLVAVQYEDTPLLEFVRLNDGTYTLAIHFFDLCGERLAVAIGDKFEFVDDPSNEWVSSQQKYFSMHHVDRKATYEWGGRQIVEIQRDGNAIVGITADLYTPDASQLILHTEFISGVLGDRTKPIGPTARKVLPKRIEYKDIGIQIGENTTPEKSVGYRLPTPKPRQSSPILYPSQPVEGDGCYCPYCNGYPLLEMTDEHVIPQSIGGNKVTVIRACVSCNNNAGSKIDSAISRHSGLRAFAISSTTLMKRQERHESVAELNDGRRLVGHFYWIPLGSNRFQTGFQPRKHQPDGSIWISEHACNDPDKLPANYNVYRDQDSKTVSVPVTGPEDAGLEVAFVKILLGVSYLMGGRDAVSLPGFDAMRSCLKGVMDPRVIIRWTDPKLIAERVPFELGPRDHLVWGECSDGKTFVGGVYLFGGFAAEIAVKDFGTVLEHRTLHLRMLSSPINAA